jgi:hypothetical protein
MSESQISQQGLVRLATGIGAKPLKGTSKAMNPKFSWMTGAKVRRWAFWLLIIAIALRFYVVRELLTAFAFFTIGFAALVSVVLSLYLLQKSLELGVVRIVNVGRWMAQGMSTAIWLVRQEAVLLKSAQDLKTKNKNSKDWRDSENLNWADGENCAEGI